MTFLHKFKYWVPVILAMALIFLMSTDAFSSRNTSLIIDPVIRFFAPFLTRREILKVHAVIRKLAHVSEYLVFGMLLFRAFRAGSPDRRWARWGLSSLAVVVLYAASDELHQLNVSTRTASFADVGIDALGGLLAQGISIAWYRRPGGAPPP